MNRIYFAMIYAFFAFVYTDLVSQVNKKNIIERRVYHHINTQLKPGKDYLENTIIIKVKDEFKSICYPGYINDDRVKNLFNSIEVFQISKKFPEHKSPEQKTNNIGQNLVDLSLIYELKYKGPVSLEKALVKMMGVGVFQYAEPHYLPQLFYQTNDPMSTAAQQYHLAKIKAYQGWDIEKGNSNVVIGIVDTGTEPSHNDLSGNIATNIFDPVNGVDDDGDGYIDNYAGWDLAMMDNNPTFVTNPHGVHVSGIAAASTDNNIGVAGVGFNCKFLPVKVSDDISGTLSAAYEGIVYAADHGADIINCSWGGGGSGTYGQDIIDYATINKNKLVVAGSGNDGIFVDFYPASYQHVISVGSTDMNDVKSNFSNYSYNVDVCAPGTQINSTWIGNGYTVSDGTSMASPCAAGVAAIIKSQFPWMNGIQVGELLKATTDTIDFLNPQYPNMLGTGRVNMFNALSAVNPKSIIMTERFVTDKADNVFVVGDTLNISGKFINVLSPVIGAKAVMLPVVNGNYLKIIDSSEILGNMNTMAAFISGFSQFKFVILPGTPQNKEITFQLTLTDATGYLSETYFKLQVNVDYMNVIVNDICTTVTSKGKIGYNLDQQLEGLGFQYNNTPLLYEGGLMIGNGPNVVSDCFRGVNGNTSDQDFQSMLAVHQNIPSTISDFDLSSKFNDALATPSLNIGIKQNTYAWSTPGNRKYVIVEYKIKNESLVRVDNLYAGICADWDIDEANFDKNKSDYIPAKQMGYTWCTNAIGLYAGIKLLSHSAPAVFYGIDNINGGNGGVDPNLLGFDSQEKFITLSTNRWQAGNSGPDGNDVINVMSSGPFNINSGDSIYLCFALIAGEDLNDLQQSADSAQWHYNQINTTNSIADLKENKLNVDVFPNPTNQIISFRINEKTDMKSFIEIIDVFGQTLKFIAIPQTNEPVILQEDLSSFAKGVYYYRLTNSNKQFLGKIVLQN